MSDKFKKKSVNGMRISVFYIFLFLILITVDQFSKLVIVDNIELNGQVNVIEGFFSLFYTRNTGSAFSLFADKSWGIYFLSAVSTVMGLLIFIFMLVASMREMKLLGLAFCLLSSGAVGNLIDRFRLKYVVDFLRFDFGTYTFPIFNFADICAVVGTIVFICIIIFASKYFEIFWNIIFPKKKNKAEKDERKSEESSLDDGGNDDDDDVPDEWITELEEVDYKDSEDYAD